MQTYALDKAQYLTTSARSWSLHTCYQSLDIHLEISMLPTKYLHGAFCQNLLVARLNDWVGRKFARVWKHVQYYGLYGIKRWTPWYCYVFDELWYLNDFRRCVLNCLCACVDVNSVEVKTEPNDITECSLDNQPTTGLFGLYGFYCLVLATRLH